MHGFYKRYDSCGCIFQECKFIDGKPDGEFRSYYCANYAHICHDIGKLATSCTYINGKIHGEYIHMDEKNNRYMITQYINGLEEGMRQIYEDNKLIAEFEMHDGQKNGSYKEYDENGKIIDTCIFAEDKRNGKGYEYEKAPFGYYITCEKNYVNGKRDGLQKYYNKFGQLTKSIDCKTIIYKYDKDDNAFEYHSKYDETIITYYLTGVKKSIVKSKTIKDVPDITTHREITEFDETGKIIRKYKEKDIFDMMGDTILIDENTKWNQIDYFHDRENYKFNENEYLCRY